MRRAEGYWGTCQRNLCMGVPVKPRRPPSLPLICIILPDQSSFSVFRGTPMAFSGDHFKKLKCNIRSDFPCNLIPQHALFDSAALHKEIQRLGIPIEVLDLPVGHVSITPVDLDGVTGDLKGRL